MLDLDYLYQFRLDLRRLLKQAELIQTNAKGLLDECEIAIEGHCEQPTCRDVYLRRNCSYNLGRHNTNNQAATKRTSHPKSHEESNQQTSKAPNPFGRAKII